MYIIVKYYNHFARLYTYIKKKIILSIGAEALKMIAMYYNDVFIVIMYCT